MRSKILDEKRPGSIIVDGGGKITYLSLPNLENMKKGGWKDNYKTF